MRFALCLLLTLGAASTNAADFRGDVRAWTGAGVDTNPRRDFTSANITPPIDLFGGLLVAANGAVETDWGQLNAGYDFGGRKFLSFPREDTLIQSVTLDGSVAVGNSLGVGLSGRIRDRRGAQREYSDLAGELYLEYLPDAHLDLKIRAGAHRFLYWNQFGSSYWGPSFGALIVYRFNRRHSAFLLGDFEPHSHNATACLRVVSPDKPDDVVCQQDPAPPRRQDSVIAIGVGYTFRGPAHFTAQYAYVDSSSNSFAETYRRHRLSATLGLRLPLDFTLLLSGAVQLAQYPEGLRLTNELPGAPDLKLPEDDENANMVSVKIVHPLGKYFDIDLKYAVYFNKLGTFTYLRMVGSLGVAWKW